LHIFKLYIALRLGVLLSSAIVYLAWERSYVEEDILPYGILFLVDLAFLFVFLGWPWLQRKMGRIYLPVALLIATAIPIIEAQYLSRLYGTGGLPEFWLVFPFLLVPLILTAWQYDLRSVVIFVMGTLLFEFVLLNSPTYLGRTDTPTRVNLLIIRSFLFLLIGYIVSNLVDAQRRQRRELAEANRKLVRYALALEELTLSRERNRLARELHDTLAHALSGVAVELEAIATICDPMPPKAQAMLSRALAATRAGLKETRRALQDLRAAPLEDLGLALAIRSLAESTAARAGLSLQIDIPEHVTEIPSEVEQTFYRVAQEALGNVALHANAQQVAVSLRQERRRLILEVSDDGSGFNLADAAPGDQLGIQGMRERAELVGGTIEVDSALGRGTTIRLSSGELVR
jgi:signal transduction histidine kinase